MPQELRVVRCFQCLKYQVDIVKKANKWACKLCGVKQSLAREFFRGTGKDCRSVVQQLSMHNLAMEQQEEEVVKLVLENKIQLPKPPVDAPKPTDTITERNERCGGPSKWESFLAKEAENDDPDDVLSAKESFESVSSTTFDRERINCGENSLKTMDTSRWDKYHMTRPDLHEDDTKLSSHNAASRNSWVAEPRNPMYKPNGPTGKAKQTTISFQGADKRNDSIDLPSFHRKENSNKRIFPTTTTRKLVSEASVVRNPSASVTSGSSVNFKPPEIPTKRKHTEVSPTPPLMNFGKRSIPDSRSESTKSNELLDNVNDSKTAVTSTSKWAKYVQEDDETDENTDNNFIMF